MADIDKITIGELDVADGTEDGDKLLIQTGDGRAKSVSKKALLEDEAGTRMAADALLQGQINALSGVGEPEEKANLSLKGAKGGLAELDENGKVPMSQIPGGADDVRTCYGDVTWDDLGNVTDIQVYADAEHTEPLEPEQHIIYLDIGETKSKNYQYMWSGNGWGRLGNSLIIGESSSNAYRGDRGKIAYDHSQARGTGEESGHNPHGLSKSDIGLGNVPDVATDDQTPTFEEPETPSVPESGQRLSDILGKVAAAVRSLLAHVADRKNPHSVTQEQVGLGNVANVATDGEPRSGSANNITSGAVFDALRGKVDKDGAVTGVKGSAEADYRTGSVSISKSDIGLGNVANVGTDSEPRSGSANNITSGAVFDALSNVSAASQKGDALTETNRISATNPPRLEAGKIMSHTVYNAGGPATYGNLLNIGGIGGGQVFFEWTGSQAAAGQAVKQGVWYRSMRDNQSAWTAWTRLDALENDGSLILNGGTVFLNASKSAFIADVSAFDFGNIRSSDYRDLVSRVVDYHDNEGLLICQEESEFSGIFLHGDGIALFSPDDYGINHYDTDRYDADADDISWGINNGMFTGLRLPTYQPSDPSEGEIWLA